LGPFADPNNKAIMRFIVKHARATLVRDHRSVQHLRDIGIPQERIHLLPDIVLSLARTKDYSFYRPLRTHAPRVAISVRDWKHFHMTDRWTGMRNYLQAIARLVSTLVNQCGAEVHFRSTCQGVPEYWADDSAIAHSIVQLVPSSVAAQIRVDSGLHSPNELCEFYSTCDLVVATRMHAAILAMCAGTPVLPIAYEYKTSELADSVGLSRWTTDIESVVQSNLDEKCKALIRDLAAVAGPMRVTVAQLAAKAQMTGEVVRSALGSVGI
jgi:colanic acid/amylovoran biosynthesis protein